MTSPAMAMDTAPLDSSGHHYAALDGLRGVAVALVFCVHAAGNSAFVVLGANFEQVRFALLPTVGERVLFWLYSSHHGVFLFFVLSGFLIGRMWWPRPVMRYRTFAWRRTLRIYPAFLLAFASSLVFAYASGTWHETRLRALAARLPTVAVVLAYLVVTSLALLDLLPAVPAILGFGVAAVFVVAKSLEPGNLVSWLLTRSLPRALGRISYSFYLVHWMLVVLVARAVSTHGQELGGVAATLAIFGGGFVASAAAATALWWLAERPYFACVRRSQVSGPRTR